MHIATFALVAVAALAVLAAPLGSLPSGTIERRYRGEKAGWEVLGALARPVNQELAIKFREVESLGFKASEYALVKVYKASSSQTGELVLKDTTIARLRAEAIDGLHSGDGFDPKYMRLLKILAGKANDQEAKNLLLALPKEIQITFEIPAALGPRVEEGSKGAGALAAAGRTLAMAGGTLAVAVPATYKRGQYTRAVEEGSILSPPQTSQEQRRAAEEWSELTEGAFTIYDPLTKEEKRLILEYITSYPRENAPVPFPEFWDAIQGISEITPEEREILWDARPTWVREPTQ